MSFGDQSRSGFPVFKHENSNKVVRHKLCADGDANQIGKLFSTKCEVLLYLHYAQTVIAALRLDRQHVMDALSIDADINFVGLDLPHSVHVRSQVRL